MFQCVCECGHPSWDRVGIGGECGQNYPRFGDKTATLRVELKPTITDSTARTVLLEVWRARRNAKMEMTPSELPVLQNIPALLINLLLGLSTNVLGLVLEVSRRCLGGSFAGEQQIEQRLISFGGGCMQELIQTRAPPRLRQQFLPSRILPLTGEETRKAPGLQALLRGQRLAGSDDFLGRSAHAAMVAWTKRLARRGCIPPPPRRAGCGKIRGTCDDPGEFHG